jgi:hypothetical protein
MTQGASKQWLRRKLRRKSPRKRAAQKRRRGKLFRKHPTTSKGMFSFALNFPPNVGEVMEGIYL